MVSENGPALSKRLKISKAQQMTMLEVLGASLLVGFAAILSIWSVRHIAFTAQVLTEKDKAVLDYEATISGIGICVDTNKDGHFSNAELQACNPDDIKISDVPGSLRSAVMTSMANNKELESVARDNQADCYDENGQIDFNKVYQEAETDDDKEQALNMIRMCSALRVIPDALPSKENAEATMASLNQLFILANWQPTSMSPETSSVASDDDMASTDGATGLQTIPVRFSMEADVATTERVLETIERSIREFDVKKMTVEWSDAGVLTSQVQIDAYYAGSLAAREVQKTVSNTGASANSSTSASAGGSN